MSVLAKDEKEDGDQSKLHLDLRGLFLQLELDIADMISEKIDEALGRVRQCEWCGKVMVAERVTRKTCSPACKMKKWRKENAGSGQAGVVSGHVELAL